MVTRKLCACVWRFWTSFWPRFRPRFFQHQPSQKSKSLTCCYLVPRFSVTPYLVPIGKVDLKKKKRFPSTSYSFLFQIKAVKQLEPVQPDRLSVSPRPESSVDGSIQLPKYKMYIHRGILQMSRQQHVVMKKHITTHTTLLLCKNKRTHVIKTVEKGQLLYFRYT